MMIEKLHIANFTAFRKADFQFVPGINVLVGANATGKTHVLKLLYAMQQMHPSTPERPYIHETLRVIFRPEILDDLVRQGNRSKTATVAGDWNGETFQFGIRLNHRGGSLSKSGEWNHVTPPVFIPVKEMLAHSVGFLALYDQGNLDFDATHRDILALALTPAHREGRQGDRGGDPLLDRIVAQLEGHVDVHEERFYLEGKDGRFAMPLVAEGWRKLALLSLLIANGSLTSGTVLYWDTPETNLNPSLMAEVVGWLYELTRRGVQIFLSTHHYILLKELDLQKRVEDTLRLFAMERSKLDGTVTVHPANAYAELSPNLIAVPFERIYDQEIKRALGGR
jgi:hypothetical protein